ncbi:MAG: bifunctional phosphoglucose/phosphomannose isomerase [Chitinophagales bacterium]|nr:bifunctional phosphoglucose/phosphomannose isomerase [Chitinophagales bacterium]MCZ2394296.1 bifunctional phosphoglucose/phosphomannose isomerase [Chitinophagales bacterium]
MDELIGGFTQQIKRAVAIGDNAKLKKPKAPIRNILLTGLGGSGIGGTIISNILRDDLKVPVVINKSYHIPNFVNENTLVIATSYSGNTEETMSALMQAFQRDAHLICVTSGGLVKEFASIHNIDFIEIDGGMPPRACFALSFIQLLYIFNQMNLVEDGFKLSLANTIQRLESEEEEIKNYAKKIAEKLFGTIPAIYSDSNYEGVAIRFRQQINENSKMLCWHHVIPEMNHNELVGWRQNNNDISVVFLRNNNDYERVQERIEFTKGVIKNYTSRIYEIYSKGDTDIERSLYLIHVCDWISYYLSELNEVDAIEIEVINSLKNKLAENPL